MIRLPPLNWCYPHCKSPDVSRKQGLFFLNCALQIHISTYTMDAVIFICVCVYSAPLFPMISPQKPSLRQCSHLLRLLEVLESLGGQGFAKCSSNYVHIANHEKEIAAEWMVMSRLAGSMRSHL